MMTGKRFLWLLAIAVSVLAAPRAAQSSVFTLDSYSVTLVTTDPGLVVWEKGLLVYPFTFPVPLNTVGDSFTTKLFRLGTNETALNLDDLQPYTINVNFQFSAPP